MTFSDGTLLRVKPDSEEVIFIPYGRGGHERKELSVSDRVFYISEIAQSARAWTLVVSRFGIGWVNGNKFEEDT